MVNEDRYPLLDSGDGPQSLSPTASAAAASSSSSLAVNYKRQPTLSSPATTLPDVEGSLLPLFPAKASPSNNSHHDHHKYHHHREWPNVHGLLSWSPHTIFVFVIWYLFSFLTLFFNKFILMDKRNDAVVLGCFQLIMCGVAGYFHVQVPIGMISSTPHAVDPMNPKRLLRKERFSRILVMVGCLRFTTLLFGLIALWFATVSFAETVKASAPIFTVLLTRFVLGEKSNLVVLTSLVPVILGLVICSSYELNFNSSALIAALATNISECFQNVFSKKLLTQDPRLDPHHLQLLTSISSLVIQVPCLVLLVDFSRLFSLFGSDSNLLLSYILNGMCFHFQSLSEYMLLSQISPVTHSVANTTKRALLILLSVATFGNEVSPQSWMGIIILFFGVYCYNQARNVKQDREEITV